MEHFTTFPFEKTWNKQIRIDGIYVFEQLLPECIIAIAESFITFNLMDHIVLILKVNHSFFFKLSKNTESYKKSQCRAFNFDKMTPELWKSFKKKTKYLTLSDVDLHFESPPNPLIKIKDKILSKMMSKGHNSLKPKRMVLAKDGATIVRKWHN